jgi:hypothetical protein
LLVGGKPWMMYHKSELSKEFLKEYLNDLFKDLENLIEKDDEEFYLMRLNLRATMPSVGACNNCGQNANLLGGLCYNCSGVNEK